MPLVEHTIEIARPAAEAFAYVADPTRFPEWQDDIVSVRMEEDRPPGVGTRFTTTRRIGRTKRTMTQEITEFNPPRSCVVHGIDGPVRPSVNINVEPLDNNTRSRVTVAIDFEGRGIGRLLVPLVVRRQAPKGAAKSFRNLKERFDVDGV